jgi:hypothetical protein
MHADLWMIITYVILLRFAIRLQTSQILVTNPSRFNAQLRDSMAPIPALDDFR